MPHSITGRSGSWPPLEGHFQTKKRNWRHPSKTGKAWECPGGNRLRERCDAMGSMARGIIGELAARQHRWQEICTGLDCAGVKVDRAISNNEMTQKSG